MSEWIKKLAERYSEVSVNESKFLIPEEIPTAERNAYMGAAAAAHKAGQSHFTFNGKKHPVTMKKDTANAIADQKEGYHDKKKKPMGEEEEVVMNPKKDKKEKKDPNAEAEMAAESTVPPVYARILEKRDAHYKKAAKSQEWGDTEKGNKGAEDMRADNAVDDSSKQSNYDKLGHDDASKANRAGPNAKPRSNDNKAGDKKIINPVAGAVTKE